MENFNNQVMEKLKEAFNSNCTKDIKGNIIQKLFIDTHNIDIFYKLKDYFLLYKKVNEDEPKPETFAYYFFAYFLGLSLDKSIINNFLFHCNNFLSDKDEETKNHSIYEILQTISHIKFQNETICHIIKVIIKIERKMKYFLNTLIKIFLHKSKLEKTIIKLPKIRKIKDIMQEENEHEVLNKLMQMPYGEVYMNMESKKKIKKYIENNYNDCNDISLEELSYSWLDNPMGEFLRGRVRKSRYMNDLIQFKMVNKEDLHIFFSLWHKAIIFNVAAEDKNLLIKLIDSSDSKEFSNKKIENYYTKTMEEAWIYFMITDKQYSNEIKSDVFRVYCERSAIITSYMKTQEKDKIKEFKTNCKNFINISNSPAPMTYELYTILNKIFKLNLTLKIDDK